MCDPDFRLTAERECCHRKMITGKSSPVKHADHRQRVPPPWNCFNRTGGIICQKV
ncbi:hypothetical protein CSB69_1156 [Morganella morganii]|nr:hypothetical protein CSB69_1156 [Morganella morganii]